MDAPLENPIAQSSPQTPPAEDLHKHKKLSLFLIVTGFACCLLIGGMLAYLAVSSSAKNTSRRSQPYAAPTPAIATATPIDKRVEPEVTIKEEYSNPFKKETQYTNPFSETTNPFDTLNE